MASSTAVILKTSGKVPSRKPIFGRGSENTAGERAEVRWLKYVLINKSFEST